MSNFSFTSGFSQYRDPSLGEVNSFFLTHNNNLIFERQIDSSRSTVLRLDRNTIRLINHFFVTGEKITYEYDEGRGHAPIGIAQTIISGIVTNYLPKEFYAVKVSDIEIRAAATPEDALSDPPRVLTFNSLGIGQHKLLANNQNKKCLIALDNIIQSPIISTGITDISPANINQTDVEFDVSDPTKFKSGDIIKIDNEYMRIFQVGIGSTGFNKIQVERPILGTTQESHLSGAFITKVQGNYNIVDNILHFAKAPYGNELSRLNEEVSGSDLEYTGLDARSKFNGRVFLRSGIPFGNQETYTDNHLFDSISDQFDGYNKSFTLTENGEPIVGFSTFNGIILINDIYQTPSRTTGIQMVNDYSMSEISGVSSITFAGLAASVAYDVNTSQLPRGGIIFSVGSTEGYGYQPLVSAGGTAIVSIAGTIQSISIGNSGSGYRPGLQIVNVGVQTQSLFTPNIEYIGTAVVSNGSVVGVSITNPGSGYNQQNPPKVVFDEPLSYWSVPLVYSQDSPPGIGTEATIDIVAGQNSNIIKFDIRNLGFGYEVGEILTVDIGGSTGIPTYITNEFSEFKIYVNEIKNDEFNGWTVGEFETFDKIEDLFDGKRKRFPLSLNGSRISIRARKGSNIDVPSTLMIFINNILQKPGDSYTIRGGSLLEFTESPREGDKCNVIFYRGTTDIDTIFRDIVEPIEPGDTVKIYDKTERLTENYRTVEEILTSDTIQTNIYGGRGISPDENYRRPIIVCQQTEDRFINGMQVNKNRRIYEPIINPETYIINSIGTASTEIFVKNIKTLFDPSNEYQTSENFQDKIIIISQNDLRAGIATAIISDNTISEIQILDSGSGYSVSPLVSISDPLTIDDNSIRATASSVIDGNGSITQINVTNPGFGYTDSALVIIEEPKIDYEILEDVKYDGDFGIIVGMQESIVDGSSQAIAFDFFIPIESYLRNETINSNVGIASTGVSGISTGYYFSVSNSNIGSSIESLNIDGTVIGVSTLHSDNVYQVHSFQYSSKDIPGIGVTSVLKVFARVSDYNTIVGFGNTEYYGDYSWGRIYNLRRRRPKAYDVTSNNLSQSPIVRRINYLKYEDYVS